MASTGGDRHVGQARGQPPDAASSPGAEKTEDGRAHGNCTAAAQAVARQQRGVVGGSGSEGSGEGREDARAGRTVAERERLQVGGCDEAGSGAGGCVEAGGDEGGSGEGGGGEGYPAPAICFASPLFASPLQLPTLAARFGDPLLGSCPLRLPASAVRFS